MLHCTNARARPESDTVPAEVPLLCIDRLHIYICMYIYIYIYICMYKLYIYIYAYISLSIYIYIYMYLEDSFSASLMLHNSLPTSTFEHGIRNVSDELYICPFAVLSCGGDPFAASHRSSWCTTVFLRQRLGMASDTFQISFGWHYLSHANSLMRPRLFYTRSP